MVLFRALFLLLLRSAVAQQSYAALIDLGLTLENMNKVHSIQPMEQIFDS